MWTISSLLEKEFIEALSKELLVKITGELRPNTEHSFLDGKLHYNGDSIDKRALVWRFSAIPADLSKSELQTPTPRPGSGSWHLILREEVGIAILLFPPIQYQPAACFLCRLPLHVGWMRRFLCAIYFIFAGHFVAADAVLPELLNFEPFHSSPRSGAWPLWTFSRLGPQWGTTFRLLGLLQLASALCFLQTCLRLASLDLARSRVLLMVLRMRDVMTMTSADRRTCWLA
ncbi:hypothetical protein AK812_SmicGene46473, partial [Symbiodinium microadriaticum]